MANNGVNMAYFKKMVGKKCYLAPCSKDDAEQWTKWNNDLEVAIPLGDEAYSPYPVERTRNDLDQIEKEPSHVFNIVDLKTDKLIGRCLLFSVHQIDRTATFGIGIGEKDYWNKGYGQEATELILDYGFNLLNLHNIMLMVYGYNKRGLACYRKVGFKEIGRRRQARIIGGKAYDVILMDILADEFESPVVKKLVEQ